MFGSEGSFPAKNYEVEGDCKIWVPSLGINAELARISGHVLIIITMR